MKEDLWPLPKPKGQSSPDWVALAGMTHPDPSYRIDNKHNYGTVIDFVVSGRGTILMDDVPYDVGPGDIYILPRYHRFKYWSHKDNPMHKYFFNVMGNLVPLLLASHGLDGHVIVPGTKTLPLFKKGLKLIADEKVTGKRLQNQLMVLLHQIIAEASESLPDESVDYPEDVKAMKHYMDTRVWGKITMQHLCDLVHKSKMQVIRSFKQSLGQTPYDYFLNLKVERAKLLLKGTGYPVKDIGYRLSFGDEYHFSSFFKKKTGMSPLQYRKGG